ncbi:MAG: exodeoxyribonuclease V subunit gamma [Eubacteriaceae bacterium]|nr:exodeoxyribonuclease V subunit gamma [Eubacteriaceae bacterium]
MGIKIIVGRRSQFLSQTVYKEIGDAISSGEENLFLIVPEQYTLGAEDALIKANDLKGLLGAEVLSPKRLGDRVLGVTGGLTKTFMDTHGKNMLLQKTLGEIQEDLTIYRSSIKKPGFLQNIGDFISELKQNEISPESLKSILETLDQGIISQKLSDIVKIFDRFTVLLGEDRLDEEDLNNLVCEKIPGTPFLKSARIWFDGFQNFSHQDYKMIRMLIGTVPEFTVALPWDPNPNACDAEVFQLTQHTVENIKQIGAQAQAEFQVMEVKSPKQKSLGLQHLEANLFAYPHLEEHAPIDDISLTQCQNTWEEVEKGAQKILGLIRDDGFSFKDIVVLTGDIEEYGSIIKRIFTQYKIPFFMDDLRAVGDNHLVEAVIAALETLQNNFRFDDIFGFVKTDFSPITLAECEDLENYVLEFGIRGKQWEREFTKISQNEALNLESLNALRLKLITPLSALGEEMKGKKTWAFRTQALYEFLVTIKIPEKIDVLVDKLFEANDYEAMGSYHQIWNILMEVFDQIAETMGEDQVSLEDYLRILRSGFQGYRLGILPPHRDVVSITDLRRSRSGAFAVLLVFGLNEGLIPGVGTEPNLISDAERLVLANHQIILQNNREFQMNQERFLVYDLLNKPQSRLYLYWALSDMEGNTRQPSLLLSQIMGIFPTLKVHSTLNQDTEELWDKISTPESTLWHLTAYLRNKKNKDQEESEEASALWNTVQTWYENSETYGTLYQTLIETLNYQGVPEELTPQDAKQLYGNTMRTSISRLERFRQCPFSHYIKYGLKPEGRPIYTVQAPEIGTLLHELIDGFFKAVDQQNLNLRSLSKEKRDTIIEAVMAKSLPQIKTNVFNSTGEYQYLGKKLERVGKKSIDILMKHLCAGEFEPKYTEFKFEQELFIPEIDLGEIKIVGKIDRLDLYQKDGTTWVKVIDYKSGNQKINFDDIYYGLSLQLLVYLDGAMSVIEGDDILPGGTFYFHVDDPIVRVDFSQSIEGEINKAFKLNGLLLDDPKVIAAMDGNSDRSKSEILPLNSNSAAKLSQSEFEAVIRYVRATVVHQITRIYQGDIQIKPYKKGLDYGCKFCEYKGICQFDDDIQKSGYEILKKTMKKNAFFELIQQGEPNEMDQ